MHERSRELEDFKTQIDFCAFATAHGYALDRRLSSRSCAVMRNAAGDKLLVSRKKNGHYVYQNVHDPADSGTIIDFVQYRDRLSLGQVRKQLREWLQGSSASIPVAPAPVLEPSEHDAAAVLSVWNAAELPLSGIPYLEQDRGLPAEIIASPLFLDRIRIGRRRNVLFAHYNETGLCGFEVKNRGFTGFATGGVKGLFCSRPRRDDRELWICETAIDALSAAALFGTDRKRFVSTAGQVSERQLALLLRAATKLPADGQVVPATDNDAAGLKLRERMTKYLIDGGFPADRIRTHFPETRGADWNDVWRDRVTSTPAGIPSP
jgi:hypothetical protein